MAREIIARVGVTHHGERVVQQYIEELFDIDGNRGIWTTLYNDNLFEYKRMNREDVEQFEKDGTLIHMKFYE